MWVIKGRVICKPSHESDASPDKYKYNAMLVLSKKSIFFNCMFSVSSVAMILRGNSCFFFVTA